MDAVGRAKQERLYIVASMGIIIPITLAMWFIWNSGHAHAVPRFIAAISLIIGTEAAKSLLFLLYAALVMFGVVRIASLTRRINQQAV